MPLLFPTHPTRFHTRFVAAFNQFGPISSIIATGGDPVGDSLDAIRFEVDQMGCLPTVEDLEVPIPEFLYEGVGLLVWEGTVHWAGVDDDVTMEFRGEWRAITDHELRHLRDGTWGTLG